MKNSIALTQLFLRITLGLSFIAACFDRFGWVAPYGSPNVSWGDWAHFSQYAHQLMPALPGVLAEWLAIAASGLEMMFGVFLIIGFFTRWVSFGSALMLVCFGLSMAATLGIHAPLSYSVFTASATGCALAVMPYYKWSIDALRKRKKAADISVMLLY